MTRTLAALVLVAILGLGACGTNATPTTALSEQEEQLEPDIPPDATESEWGRGAKWAALVPGNIVWWPWKAIGRGGRGIVDGSAEGFDHGMPILGVIFLPLNAITGFVTGLAEGAWMGPGIITPDHDYGREMAKPIRLPVTVWWYGD